jgi:uncharacterized cysteine cluster protein YcgN (CxxCxxCC family)
MSGNEKFWQSKTLDQLTPSEWEQLCDGCARCCLYKLQDEDNGEVEYTDIACKLLDLDKCRCTDYHNRHIRMPTCVQVTPQLVRTSSWLPATCAYRLLGEGKPLNWWHPLLCGNTLMIHRVGISIKSIAELETDVTIDELEEHVVEIPLMKDIKGE